MGEELSLICGLAEGMFLEQGSSWELLSVSGNFAFQDQEKGGQRLGALPEVPLTAVVVVSFMFGGVALKGLF